MVFLQTIFELFVWFCDNYLMISLHFFLKQIRLPFGTGRGSKLVLAAQGVLEEGIISNHVFNPPGKKKKTRDLRETSPKLISEVLK